MVIRSHLRALAVCALLLTLLLPQPFVSYAADPDAPTAVSFSWSATWGDAPQSGFGQATGIDVGPEGNVYVSDAVRNDVQVFTPAGELVRRFGAAGSNPGQYREPSDVATAAGRVYVADRNNGRVHVLTQDGAFVSEIDGRQPVPGGAPVRLPTRVDADATGRIFLMNDGDFHIYRYAASGGFERRYDTDCLVYVYQGVTVLSSGTVFCSAINGGFWRLPLEGPGTLIGDKSQANPLGPLVYFAAAPDDSVWVYRNDGVWPYESKVTALIHLATDGSVLGQYPVAADITDLAASANRVFALTSHRRVRVYDWGGQVLGEWGGDAFAGQNTYERPDRIAPAPDGSFYVLEGERKRVRHVAPDGHVLAVLSPGAVQGNLSKPIDMAVDGLGRLYVLDQEYYTRIVRFANDRFDTVISVLSSYPYMDKMQSINVTGDTVVLMGYQPGSIAVHRVDLRGARIGQTAIQGGSVSGFVDAAFGTADRLFALVLGNPVVHAVDFAGTQLASWGTMGSTTGPGMFVYPSDIAADLRGRIFVADTDTPPMFPPVHADIVQVFDQNGRYLTQFGGYGSGQGQFVNPQGVAALADGRVVVADMYNNRLQVFAPSGDLPALQPLPKPQVYGDASPTKLGIWQDLGPRGIGSFSSILIPAQQSAEHPIVGVYGVNALALSSDGLVWQRQKGSPFPSGEQLMYAGSRTLISSGPYGDAAYRSDDLGQTWVRLGDVPPSGPRFLAPSPSYDQDRTLFLAAYEGGIWRSTDAGATWQLRGEEARTFYDLVALPDVGAKRALLALTGAGVLRSTDDGATWQVVNKDLSASTDFHVSPTFRQDHTIFATDPYIRGNGIYRSTDGGLTWTIVGAETGTYWYYLTLSPTFASDKTLIVWYGSNVGGKSFISKDGGNSWAQFTAENAPLSRWMAFAPTYATDGAVWRQRFDVPTGIEVTRDGGATWQRLSAAPGTQVTGLAQNTPLGQPLWAAAAHGIVSLPASGDASFLYRFQHDWGGRIDLALSPAFDKDGTAIGEGVITHNRGATWQDLPFAAEARSALSSWVSSEVVTFSGNYVQNGRVLVAWDSEPTDKSSELRRSSDHGATWLSSTVPVAAIAGLAFDANGPDTARIYAAGEGGVAVSTDGGATWRNVGGPLALLRVTGLVVRNEANVPTIYAATSSAGMWRSTDGGDSWAHVNDGMRDGYLCALAGNEELLVTSTCAGQVHLWNKSASSWTPVLPPVSGKINALLVQGSAQAGKISVATADGAFSMTLPAGKPERLWLPLIAH